MKIVSERAGAAARAFDAVKDFNFQSRYAVRRGDADIAEAIGRDWDVSTSDAAEVLRSLQHLQFPHLETHQSG